MSDYMPKCATCEHFESCIMQKHITEMALILWNISREKEKERTVNKPRRKSGRVMDKSPIEIASMPDIVRCKECRWDKAQMIPKEVKCIYQHNADDFCSYGEREGE